MTGRARHALVLFAVAAASTAVSALQTRGADHVVPSRPETVVWGWIPIDRPPVATVQPGQTVRRAGPRTRTAQASAV